MGTRLWAHASVVCMKYHLRSAWPYAVVERYPLPFAPSVTSLTTTEKLDALVGTAVLGMVASGASAAAIGAFAAKFRSEAAEILGEVQKDEVPDLHAVVRNAVDSALDAKFGTGTQSQSPLQAASRSKTQRVAVVTAAGKRTMVTLPVSLMNQLNTVTGSRKKTASMVKEIASSAPDNLTNRSKWLTERLQSFAIELQQPRTQLARH